MKRLLIMLFLTVIVLSSCTPQNGTTEEVKNEPNYPYITAQGVEPFLINSSLFKISPKGEYYDTLLIDKRFNIWDDDGFPHGLDLNEVEMKRSMKEGGEYCNVYAVLNVYVIKDNDTLMKITSDDSEATIKEIEILSKKIQLQNGICVGMSAEELFEKYNAQCLQPNIWMCEDGLGDDTHYDIPAIPENISVKAFYKQKYSDYVSDQSIPHEAYIPLPVEIVNGNSVRSIVINKPR